MSPIMSHNLSTWNDDEARNRDRRPRTAPERVTEGPSTPLRQLPANLDPSPGPSSHGDAPTTSPPSNSEINEDGHTYEILPSARANTKKRRMTHRKLLPIHVFMITINTILGTGLYWRGGQILALGGSLAVILSFLLLGMLSWGVMQCITELLCIWPVPGSLSVFVREFVDFELGIAVGVAYWFTCSVAFAALIAATAAEIHKWADEPGLDAGVLYLLVPLILVVINSFGIQIYGWFEVVTGVIKLFFLAIIIVAMIPFAVQGIQRPDGQSNWDDPTSFDDTVASSWGPALFICLSTATFSYVGVETPAAVALEARPTKSNRTSPASSQGLNDATSIGETVRFASKWASVFACIAYTLSGILVSLSVDTEDCGLPRPSYSQKCPNSTQVQSAFVLTADTHGQRGMGDAFNMFLVFSALSCANTNLYLASRTLFGLTNQIDGGSNVPWYLTVLAWFGRTNSYRVPIRAMAVSALAFAWVPFLQLGGGAGVNTFISVLAEMSSIAVLIVWAAECLAFIRYYHCVNRHKSELIEQRVPRVQRSNYEDDDYPYRSNGQPVTAYMSFAACILILLVINGASLWKGFHPDAFLSSYLIVILFVALWVLLKLWRGAKWTLVDLSDPDNAIQIIRSLHETSFAGFHNEPTVEAGKGSSLWPLSLIVGTTTRGGERSLAMNI
ncbi:amino acid permease-domain-containing protein [Hypoxylon crocopeplum]|nr:amino acid permease-domain-containing protein [Hypoxylon crocopeplum]